jgi:hypothetical protein
LHIFRAGTTCHEFGLEFKPLIEMNPPEFFLGICSGNVSGIDTPEDLKGQDKKNSQNDDGDHSDNEGATGTVGGEDCDQPSPVSILEASSLE